MVTSNNFGMEGMCLNTTEAIYLTRPQLSSLSTRNIQIRVLQERDGTAYILFKLKVVARLGKKLRGKQSACLVCVTGSMSHVQHHLIFKKFVSKFSLTIEELKSHILSTRTIHTYPLTELYSNVTTFLICRDTIDSSL